MKVVIETKETYFDEGAMRYRKILSVKMKGKDELDITYLRAGPSCWLEDKTVMYNKCGAIYKAFTIGTFVPEWKFQKMLIYIVKCSERLKAQKEREEERIREWSKKETFEV